MGYSTNGRLIHIVVCLLVAAFFVYHKPSAAVRANKEPLSRVFYTFGDWQQVEDNDLQQNVLESLELDDYLFRNFSHSGRVVSLYIGYYRSAAKVGAAHSPLVCFPGQGWEISTPQKISVPSKSRTIKLEKLIARKGRHNELLLYWFQAYDMTSSGTFMQKVYNFWARLNGNPEDNAFVRVSVSIENDDMDSAYATAIDFIENFYPVLLEYITT